jgi:hypothetical protein
VVARAIAEVLTRERSPLRLFDPRITARLFIPRRTPPRPSSKAWRSSPVRATKEPA